MAKLDILDILRYKAMEPGEFDFDNLMIPPMNVFLDFYDIENLRYIATSIKLSSKIEEKYKMIDDIMKRRGFKRFAAGTNRVVYSFLEDDRFLAKIAVDKVGMQDNPAEFQNQFLLKPYVTKMFYTSPCGTIGFSERVLPIKNVSEFREVAEDVYYILRYKIDGRYILEDVGTKYFMNWGTRIGFGPVLLDYPYVYRLDGTKKLYCSKIVDPILNLPCNGEILYDPGFNHLTCSVCGKRYAAVDLKDDSSNNKPIIKGGNKMRIDILRNGKSVYQSIISNETIEKPKNSERKRKKNKEFSISVIIERSGENNPNTDTDSEKKNVSVVKTITEPLNAEEKKVDIAKKGKNTKTHSSKANVDKKPVGKSKENNTVVKKEETSDVNNDENREIVIDKTEEEIISDAKKKVTSLKEKSATLLKDLEEEDKIDSLYHDASADELKKIGAFDNMNEDVAKTSEVDVEASSNTSTKITSSKSKKIQTSSNKGRLIDTSSKFQPSGAMYSEDEYQDDKYYGGRVKNRSSSRKQSSFFDEDGNPTRKSKSSKK